MVRCLKHILLLASLSIVYLNIQTIEGYEGIAFNYEIKESTSEDIILLFIQKYILYGQGICACNKTHELSFEIFSTNMLSYNNLNATIKLPGQFACQYFGEDFDEGLYKTEIVLPPNADFIELRQEIFLNTDKINYTASINLTDQLVTFSNQPPDITYLRMYMSFNAVNEKLALNVSDKDGDNVVCTWVDSTLPSDKCPGSELRDVFILYPNCILEYKNIIGPRIINVKIKINDFKSDDENCTTPLSETTVYMLVQILPNNIFSNLTECADIDIMNPQVFNIFNINRTTTTTTTTPLTKSSTTTEQPPIQPPDEADEGGNNLWYLFFLLLLIPIVVVLIIIVVKCKSSGGSSLNRF
jgi:hypothetical protein